MSGIVKVDISNPEFLDWLEAYALPAYFQTQRWYARHDTTELPVLKLLELGVAPSGLLLGLVEENMPLSEMEKGSPYLVALLAMQPENVATDGLISTIPTKFISGDAVLVEATSMKLGQYLLLRLLIDSETIAWSTGFIRGRIFEQKNVEREKTGWRHSSRSLGAEQSNSSIVYDDSVILKLFRRPGLPGLPNPDVEIPLGLSLTTELPLTPSVMGVLQSGSDDQPLMLGTLCRFLKNAESGWDIALKDAADSVNPLAVSDLGPTSENQRLSRDLAIRTAELHVALSRIPDNDAFSPVPVKAADLVALGHQLKAFGEQVFSRIGQLRLDSFSNEISARLWYLLDQQPRLMARFDTMINFKTEEPDRTLFFKVRHHGDYHLGQVLFDKKLGWQVIDFEGEPNKSLETRRGKQIALRDVAGMIRSFDYAQAVVAQKLNAHSDQKKQLGQWRDDLVSIFSNTYFAMVGDVEHEIFPLIPSDYRLRFDLLDAFVLEKNLYELIYEIEHRPDWVEVPLNALVELLEMTDSA